MLKILLNRNFIFTLSLATGLAAGGRLGPFTILSLPVLMLIMTVSLTETDFTAFKDIKKSTPPFLAGIVLNYLFIFFAVVLLGYLFGIEGKIRAGLVLTAATPPGLAIIPFAALLGGNLFYATAATLSAFGAAVVLTPWLTSLFMGGEAVGYAAILDVLLKLIFIPLAIGRILRFIGLANFARRVHGPVVNIGFGIIFAVIFGVNRNLIFTDPGSVIKLLIIFVVVIFGLLFTVKGVLKNINIDRKTKISIILTATVKNSIFGATAGLTLLGPEGALAGTVMTFVTLLYLMFAEKLTAGVKDSSV